MEGEIAKAATKQKQKLEALAFVTDMTFGRSAYEAGVSYPTAMKYMHAARMGPPRMPVQPIAQPQAPEDMLVLWRNKPDGVNWFLQDHTPLTRAQAEADAGHPSWPGLTRQLSS